MQAPPPSAAPFSAPGPRPLRGRLLLLLASVVSTLGLAECGLHVAHPDVHRVWLPGMEATFHPSPEVLPGMHGASHFRVNSQGMRGREPVPGDRYRVLALGGSTTECLFLDQAEAWPALLEARLSTSGRPVFVGNVGRSGLTSRDNALQVSLLLPEHPDTDAVVVLAGINDLQLVIAGQGPRQGSPTVAEYRRAFMILPLEESVGSEQPFWARTELYQLFVPGRASAVREQDLVQDPAGLFYRRYRQRRHQSPEVSALPDLTLSLTLFRQNLEGIVRAATERHVRVVFMTQPSLWSSPMVPHLEALLWFGWGPEWHYHYAVAALAAGLARYNQVTLDVCRAHAHAGVSCLDLASLLSKDTTTFYDDCHFNESGAREVADALGTHFHEADLFGSE